LQLKKELYEAPFPLLLNPLLGLRRFRLIAKQFAGIVKNYFFTIP